MSPVVWCDLIAIANWDSFLMHRTSPNYFSVIIMYSEIPLYAIDSFTARAEGRIASSELSILFQRAQLDADDICSGFTCLYVLWNENTQNTEAFLLLDLQILPWVFSWEALAQAARARMQLLLPFLLASLLEESETARDLDLARDLLASEQLQLLQEREGLKRTIFGINKIRPTMLFKPWTGASATSSSSSSPGKQY